MTVILTIIAGPGQGRSVACDRELIIGREGADVVLADQVLSGRHAAVRPAGNGIEIEDLGSASGTFVDGERITGPILITDDAELKLGETRFIVEARAARDEQPALDIRPPALKSRQEAVTVVRDAPPPLGPPPSGAPGGQPPNAGPPGAGPPFGGPPGGGPPRVVRLLIKTSLGRAIMRRRMASTAKRGRPQGPQR